MSPMDVNNDFRSRAKSEVSMSFKSGTFMLCLLIGSGGRLRIFLLSVDMSRRKALFASAVIRRENILVSLSMFVEVR